MREPMKQDSQISTETRPGRARCDAADKSAIDSISKGPWARHSVTAPTEAGAVAAPAEAALVLSVNPDMPQSAVVVTRPWPLGGFSSLISRLTRFVTFASAYPKNQPSWYLLVARRCPPALGIERYVTPSRSTC